MGGCYIWYSEEGTYYSTSNNSKMVQDKAMRTMADQRIRSIKDTEPHLRGVYSDTTQLNSTDPVEQRTAKSVVFLFMTS